jgi:two-component system, chemotaxis family, chemotaxis protein CheY
VAARATYDLSGIRVLVIDDNRFMRRLAHTILRGLGVGAVTEASDSDEALGAMSVSAPDIIVTDLTMSPIDGIEFVRLLRNGARQTNPLLPVVLMTAHSQVDLICAARDAGVTEVLAKPISPSTLANRISEIIERPRPFIRSPNFFGPDRRRRKAQNDSTPRRRAADRMAKDGGGQGQCSIELI